MTKDLNAPHRAQQRWSPIPIDMPGHGRQVSALMIIADLNLLLYTYDALSAQHEAAKQWWIDILAGPEVVGLCDVVVFGFIRITTRRGIYAQPMLIPEVLEIVRSWLNHPNVELLTPNAKSRAICFDLIGKHWHWRQFDHRRSDRRPGPACARGFA